MICKGISQVWTKTAPFLAIGKTCGHVWFAGTCGNPWGGHLEVMTFFLSFQLLIQQFGTKTKSWGEGGGRLTGCGNSKFGAK